MVFACTISKKAVLAHQKVSFHFVSCCVFRIFGTYLVTIVFYGRNGLQGDNRCLLSVG